MTEIVEQRMKMEDNENKEETAKGISWLIESLTESEKKENPQRRPGAERSEPIQERRMGTGRGQQT